MKLLSATILGDRDFRSLKANKRYSFRDIDEGDGAFVDEPGISKMVFTGMNGSGKSNFLQFLAETFSFLDGAITLKHYKPTDGDFGFEICYLLFLSFDKLREIGLRVSRAAYVEVRVVKRPFREVEFSAPKGVRRNEILVEGDAEREILKNLLDNEIEFSVRLAAKGDYRRIDRNQHLLLPNKIVAYSSGHNELLSNPFYRSKYRHFLEFESSESQGYFDDRLLFLDYSTAHYVAVANFLLSDVEKVERWKKQLSIDSLRSFRLSINFKDYRKKKIRISNEVLADIEKLKKCASSWIHKNSSSEDLLILDYYVDTASKAAFSFHFQSAYSLFRVLLQLHTLNINSVGKDLRSQVVRSPKWIVFAEEMAKQAPYDLPFRLERVELNKITSTNPLELRPIFFRSLSDGEQQFMHLVGTIMLFAEGNVLYLFDEPETHFNPQWKYNYFQILDSIASEVDSDILLTTHDPVLVSGIKREQLMMFKKTPSGDVNISNPESDIVGMGADAILTSEIFGLNSTLDSKTLHEMVERRELLAKKEREGLTVEENERLSSLAETLMGIDYNVPFADPLYKDFVLSLENLSDYKRTDLTFDEIKEREEIAKEVMKKLINSQQQ